MLDLDRLTHMTLYTRPLWQDIFAQWLTLNYRLAGVEVVLEGSEHLDPDRPLIIAMNHTDRYNYFPFQHALWKQRRYRYTATWTKGKYFDNPLLALFHSQVNNLPVPSRGYVLAKDFFLTLQRKPSEQEYRTLKAWLEHPDQAQAPSPQEADLHRLWTTPRTVLGLPFSPDATAYPHFLDQLFGELMGRFVDLNRQALFEKSLNILLFPQGTRSRRLSRGHIGLAQLALATGVPILPVGCSGCDERYPGNLPLARGGRVTYRIGPLLTWEGALAPFRLETPFRPFTREAEGQHRAHFQALTDRVMDEINGLLEPPYQYAPDRESTGVQGVSRFL